MNLRPAEDPLVVVRLTLSGVAPNEFEGGYRIWDRCRLVNGDSTDLALAVGLALAGVDVPKSKESRSPGFVLQIEARTGRDAVFAEHGRYAISLGTPSTITVCTADRERVQFLDAE